MTKSPSDDVPSLDQGGAKTGTTDATSKTAQAAIRLLHCLLAVVAVFVCAVVSRPATENAHLLTVAAASADNGAEQARRHALRGDEGVSRAAEVTESESDDDDDSLDDVAHDLAPPFRALAIPRQPECEWRAEHRVDPSRFAACTGLPRGPPA